jgi:thiol:disulfide interchange protein
MAGLMASLLRWGLMAAVAVAMAGCQTQPSGKPHAGSASGTGIAWNYDYTDGMAKAEEAGKPVMVDVFATWCAPCKLLDENVFSQAEVIEASKSFVTVRVDGDKNPDFVTKWKVGGYPTVMFLTPDGKELGRSIGAVPYQNMLESMDKARGEFRG